MSLLHLYVARKDKSLNLFIMIILNYIKLHGWDYWYRYILTGTVTGSYFRCIYDVFLPREKLFGPHYGQSCIVAYIGYNKLNNTIGKMDEIIIYQIMFLFVLFNITCITKLLLFSFWNESKESIFVIVCGNISFQVIPRTSYYKIIDVWFLFLIVLLVLTITFHSIIMMILGKFNR